MRSGSHKDAARFADGREVSLQSLNPGIAATMFVPLPDFGLDQVEARAAGRDLVDA